MWENVDKKISEYEHFLRSVILRIRGTTEEY